MNRLNDLIEKYCPDGVEYKRLGDITQVLRGKRLTKNQLSDEKPYAVYHGGLEPLGYYDIANRTANTTMVINVGASAGTVGFSKEDFWSSDGCYCIDHTDALNDRFVYYFLSSQEHTLKSRVRVAGIPTLDRPVVEDFILPVPPLAVQEEIVRILDNFTTLTAELQAELQARRRQYEHYRDHILSFGGSDNTPTNDTDTIKQHCTQHNGSVEWKKLGDVCKLARGTRVVKKDLSQSAGYPVFQNSLKPLGYYEQYNREEHTTFVIYAGAAGDIGYSEGKFWAADDCFSVMCPEGISNRFIYYCLKSQQSRIYSQVRKASIPRLSHNAIEALNIPIPPLAEQQRIVDILDRFDALTNDITAGLPAEIEARQQQYEYYRDKLLSFRELRVES